MAPITQCSRLPGRTPQKHIIHQSRYFAHIPVYYSPRGSRGRNYRCRQTASALPRPVLLTARIFALLLIGQISKRFGMGGSSSAETTIRGIRELGLVPDFFPNGMAAQDSRMDCFSSRGLTILAIPSKIAKHPPASQPNPTCDILPNAFKWGGARPRRRALPAERYENRSLQGWNVVGCYG